MPAKLLSYILAAVILTPFDSTLAQQPQKIPRIGFVSVSYTHLTLPTIYSV